MADPNTARGLLDRFTSVDERLAEVTEQLDRLIAIQQGGGEDSSPTPTPANPSAYPYELSSEVAANTTADSFAEVELKLDFDATITSAFLGWPNAAGLCGIQLVERNGAGIIPRNKERGPLASNERTSYQPPVNHDVSEGTTLVAQFTNETSDPRLLNLYVGIQERE